MAAAAGAVVLAIAAAGCGSGSGSPSTTTALSAAAWRVEANAICRRNGRAIRDVRPARHGDEFTGFVAAVAPLWKRELDSTRALAAPTEIVVTVGEYVGALDFLNRNLVEMYTAAERNDSSRLYNATLSIEGAADDAKRAARRLGLQACARQRIP
jgi:hypothetical protein